MFVLTMAVKDIFRRPTRSLLTIAAMSVAICAVVALLGASAGFEDSFYEMYDERDIDLVVVRAGASERLTSSLDETVGERIRSIPGVEDVLPGLVDVVSFEAYGMYGVAVQGWEPGSYLFRTIRIVEGRNMTAEDRRCVLLGAITARNLGIGVGEDLEIYEDEPFRIVGIFESFSVFENGSLVVLLDELQELMDRQGQVTGFSVISNVSKQPEKLTALRREIESIENGLAALPTQDHVASLAEARLVRAIAWLVSAIALVIGSLGMINTMLMSVFERTREIGILRAIGWRARRVVRLILIESVLLSIGGAILGSIGGVILLKLLTRLPLTAGVLDGRVDPWVVIQGFVIAVVIGFLGGIIPAWRGASLLPTEAIRHE